MVINPRLSSTKVCKNWSLGPALVLVGISDHYRVSLVTLKKCFCDQQFGF